MFSVGNDPLMKANCTTTTAITQKLTTITQKLTTITSEQVKSTPTTIPASVTSQIVSAGDQPPVTPKASKSQVIIAVSLSVIALLVLIVIAVGIAAFRKRRYATVCFVSNFDSANNAFVKKTTILIVQDCLIHCTC